jgi:hypothetical protein
MRSRMSAHSDPSDTNSDDGSHTLSHRRCVDTITTRAFLPALEQPSIVLLQIKLLV